MTENPMPENDIDTSHVTPFPTVRYVTTNRLTGWLRLRVTTRPPDGTRWLRTPEGRTP